MQTLDPDKEFFCMALSDDVDIGYCTSFNQGRGCKFFKDGICMFEKKDKYQYRVY
jgi:hypothetical protein